MKTILVIDDERSIVTAWKRILQVEGYRVATASNGLEGLVAAKQVKPDLIITDRSMPIMDGVEFCRHLKQKRKLSGIPVILTSADHRQPGVKVWDEFLPKPVTIEVLLASIRHFLNRDDAQAGSR
ncbi:response regulator [Paraburkholderia strydomiana]|uniref:response regulator n=1 Tax=Paraburkholderia strydomiana TaxID=1245417 RepID=UPI002864A2C4|nr:response regulator [Paraburkholderia strydomiana]MDR7009896.1 CheY-like chemotaxis protein [Paraburkholderia strydomiana]